MTKQEEFLKQVALIITNSSLIKMSLGKQRNGASVLKNIFIKPVMIKEKPMLSFVYRNATNDITKNFDLADSIAQIKNLLDAEFYNADVFCSQQTLYYSEDNKTGKQKLVIKTLDGPITIAATAHDKQKQRLINANDFYLQALGVTTKEGRVKAEMQHKFKQINRYVEIIEGILKDSNLNDHFSIVDMGSGKGYLTFALYSYLVQKNKSVQVTGVELREDLIEKCNKIAAASKMDGLQFILGSIQDYTLPHTDMLIALHACDTATDDAIAKGITAKATHIICAPCCHKQIRKQMKPGNILNEITKHGILLERQAEMVTDTIRALLLEAYGYKTTVFDFIEAEHTPKNVLIVGKLKAFSQQVFDENIRKVEELKKMFGIEKHYLEGLLTNNV